MEKSTCVMCGTELKWGGFAHNQDTCFDCFKKEIKSLIKHIDQYKSWPLHKRERHKSILNWMMALVAEKYGYEW